MILLTGILNLRIQGHLNFTGHIPFNDGNGRIARLLSILLLYKAGYEVSRYISLEMVVEETRDGYYDSLYKSSQGWHEAKHSLIPWWEYFLGVMLLTAYKKFEEELAQSLQLVAQREK